MNSISIGIFFIDKEYGEELSKALVMHYKNFNVFVLENEQTDLQNRESPADMNPKNSGEENFVKVDILITDAADFYDNHERKNMIFVSDMKAEDITKGIFYKYDSVHSLADHIVMTLEREKKKAYPVQADRQGEVYVFAGASGGTGTTSIALTAARSLCRFHGKNVFFIPMTFFCREMSDVLGGEESHKAMTLQRFLYDLETAGIHNLPLEKYVSRDCYGVMYFNSGSNLNFIRHMDSDQISFIIKTISKLLKADVFIIDAGSDFSDKHIDFLECGRKIFIIHKKKEDIEATRNLKKLFKRSDDNEADVYNIVNFAPDFEESTENKTEMGEKTETERKAEENQQKKRAFIHKDPDSFNVPENSTKKYEIEQDREFGMEVADFVQRCMMQREKST